MMPHILGNSYQIVQAPGLVAIRYELVHDVRIIPLDGSAHLTKAFELEMGDARGHWDGNALVVESTNLQRSQRVPQRQRRHASSGRALHAYVGGSNRMVGHRRRSGDMDDAVDVLACRSRRQTPNPCWSLRVTRVTTRCRTFSAAHAQQRHLLVRGEGSPGAIARTR